MNKKLRFMWMLLLALVTTAAWAEKLDDSGDYTTVSFTAQTDESAGTVLSKGGITLTLSQGSWTATVSDGGTAGWEFAAGTTVTVTGGDVVKIPLMFTGVQWGDPDPVSYEGNGVDGFFGFKNNWYWRSETDGKHESVTFTIASDCKLTSIEVWTVPTGGAVVSPPVIGGDEFFDEQTTVSITADAGADIYYTTDYNVPTVASTKYTGPFTLTETTRVQAIAVLGGVNSEVTARNFTKRLAKPAAPVITGDSPFVGSTEITITSDGATDQIYYTTDGAEPTYESTAYTGPFSITETTTIKAMYVRNGGPSEVAEATFVKYEAPQEGEYTIAQLAAGQRDVDNVTLRLTDAQVVYGESSASGSVRVVREGTKAIDLMNTDLALPVGTKINGTVKLNVKYNQGILTTEDIAGETNQNALQTSHDGNYEMRPVSVKASEVAQYPGDLVSLENVRMEVTQGVYLAVVTEDGQDYYFRLDNGDEFQLKDGQTCGLTAWYYAPGAYGTVAMMRVASVEQHYAAPAAPVIEGETPFETQTTVTMTSEPGTTIHYTLDGSNPTTLSPLYTKPFVITETTTVKALAERDELASEVAEKTFTKREQVEWVETTLDQVAAEKKDVPYAILTLENALAAFTADYGRSWVIRDGGVAMHWNTSNFLATNYEYYGTVRLRIEYNDGFITAYDIEGETSMDDIATIDHYGDWDYHFTKTNWDEIEAGQHKGDFIMIKHVKVVKETDTDGVDNYYAGTGDNRLYLTNPKDFAYYWNDDPSEYHDVGGWYLSDKNMYVARLRLGVGVPTIEGDETFEKTTQVRITGDNPLDDIYYTTDGSDPADVENAEVHNYVGPFTISETTTVKAVSSRYEGWSDVVERTFTKDISGISAAEVAEDGFQTESYNLQGQRVGKDYKGIVVEKGHKRVSK